MMPGPSLLNCYPANSSLCSVYESDSSAANETLFLSSLDSLLKKKKKKGKQKEKPIISNFQDHIEF